MKANEFCDRTYGLRAKQLCDLQELNSELLDASRQGDTDKVKRLLEAGANIEAKDNVSAVLC